METRNALYKRVRKQVPLSGLSCETCGSMENLQRHHKDHGKPMEITVLCRKCHGRVSAARRWAGHSKTRECLWCQATYMPTRSRQTTCSRSCGNKRAWNRR